MEVPAINAAEWAGRIRDSIDKTTEAAQLGVHGGGGYVEPGQMVTDLYGSIMHLAHHVRI